MRSYTPVTKAHVATLGVFFSSRHGPSLSLHQSDVTACDHCLPCCDVLCAVLCQVLGEVIQPGDRLVVAEGGKGGRGVVAPSRIQKQTELKKEYERAQVCGGGVDTDSASSQSINHSLCLGVGRGGGGEVCRSEAFRFRYNGCTHSGSDERDTVVPAAACACLRVCVLRKLVLRFIDGHSCCCCCCL
jgi:hypothetical protein